MKKTKQVKRVQKLKEAKEKGDVLIAIHNHFYIHFGFDYPLTMYKP